MNKIKIGLLFTLIACLYVSSCKKKKEEVVPDSPEAHTTQVKDDNFTLITYEEILNDVNNYYQQSSQNGLIIPLDEYVVCGAIVDKSQLGSGYVKFTFNGNENCYGKRREGIIEVQLSNGKWNQEGAFVTITLTNYKNTRILDGKSIAMNGAFVCTNVTGRIVLELALGGDPVIHKATGAINMNFDNKTSLDWNISRKRTYTFKDGVFSLSIEGDHTINDITGVDTWGKNRAGKEFYAYITEPLVANSVCNFSVMSGIRIHKHDIYLVTVTFGLIPDDQNCPTSFKVNWTTQQGEDKELTFPYIE
jgi:hypothetical protein